MVAEAKKKPELVFAGVFQHRFDAVHRVCKSLIDRGALGRMLLGTAHLSCLRTDGYYQGDAWRGTWAEEGGAILINQAIHFVDQLAWMMGGVTSVSGAWANLTHQQSMETEDSAVAALTFASGAVGTVTATCSSHLGWEPLLSLRGDEGSIDIRNGAPTLVAFADKERERAVAAEFAGARDPSHQAVKGHYGPSHPSQIADFVDAIRSGGRPFVSAEDARHAVDIVLAVYESHRTGRRVQVTSKSANP
jgi:predicted dehydrogenase